MCLFLSDKFPRDKVLSKLPDPFPVWRVMRKFGYAQFDLDEQEATTLDRKTHVAVKGKSWYRMKIDYEPSFHAFLHHKDALKYVGNRYWNIEPEIIRKYWVCKADVVKIGPSLGAYMKENVCCIAARKITRK